MLNNITNRFTITLVAILAWGACLAGDYSVTGMVTDSEGEPQPYATLRVYQATDTVKSVSIAAAGEDGAFFIPLPSTGDYRLTVSAVGMTPAQRLFSVSSATPSVDLGAIALSGALNELGEVTVTAQRPLVVKEIDRLGYDVQADEDSKTSNVLDILRKVPLVTINSDGSILVNGSSDYKIYRNGRPNQAYSQNAKELFKGIPAATIKKIEVITDPGAKEDAEGVGAILNIVTMDNMEMNGVAGNAGFSMNSLEWYPNNAWLNLTTQYKKFTISPYAGIWHGDKSQRSSQTNRYTFEDSGNTIVSDIQAHSKGTFAFWGFDSSLEIDSLNLLNLEYNGNIMRFNQRSSRFSAMTAADGAPIYSYNSTSATPGAGNMSHSAAINYQRSTRRKGETITLSYRVSLNSGNNSSETHYYDMINFPSPYTATIVDSKTFSQEHTAQIDWSRPFGSIHKLDLGGKYIYRRNHSRSDVDYVGYQDESTRFLHQTHVAALYADYRVTLKRFTLRGGVRYEYSYLGGKYPDSDERDFGSSLNDIVPSVAVNYAINDANSVKLSYNMRVNRPGINLLNPAVVESPTSVTFGDPALKSANTHQARLNYTYTSMKFNIDANIDFQATTDGIIAFQYTNDDKLYSTYANAGRSRMGGASLYAQWMISDKTSMMFNGNVRYKHFSNPDAVPGTTLKNHGWEGSFHAQLSQRLPWKLRATVSLSYWGGYIDGVYSVMRPEGAFAFDHGISLDRSFLKDDRLTVKLSANNPFGPYSGSARQTSLNSGMNGYARYTMPHTALAQISVSYRFGTLKAAVKKTKGITNDDVESSSSSDSKTAK